MSDASKAFGSPGPAASPPIHGLPAGAPEAASGTEAMAAAAAEASEFLKALAHEARLLILCHLAEGELSVSDLERRLGMRQAAVSQQLARLRLDGLVTSRRDGKTVLYSLADARAVAVVNLLHQLFCPPVEERGR